MRSRLLVGIVAGALLAGTAGAASLESTYAGKTITIVIPYGMGGTYGQYAQFMAGHLPRFIPGAPHAIVQSIPGAGGLKGTNYAYSVMPKSGLNMLVPPDSIIISELLNPQGARYKSSGFNWLGTVSESNSVIVVSTASGVRTLEEARQKEVMMGSTGKGSQTFLVPSLLNGLLGTKFKIIMGYKGSAGSALAIERNEIHGVSLTWNSLRKNRGNWFDKSDYPTKATAIVQLGFRAEPDLKGVPMAADLVKTPEEKQIVNFMASLGPIGRGLTLPPGVPKDIVAPLRAAFDRMIVDKRFLAEAAKRKLDVNPKSGAEVQKIVADIGKMSPAVIERARKLVFGK